jgi:hypothetical protein
LKFLQEKDKDLSERSPGGRAQKNDFEDLESKSPATELTPLRSGKQKSAAEKAPLPNELEGLDFFRLLEEELNKINKFYSSKLTGELCCHFYLTLCYSFSSFPPPPPPLCVQSYVYVSRKWLINGKRLTNLTTPISL